MSFEPKETRSPRSGSIILRDLVRSYDGIDLHRARDARSDRLVLAKVVKDRNIQEIAHWEHVALALVNHPLVPRPLEVSRDERDHALYVYDADAFVMSERAEEATLDGVVLARHMLEVVAALHGSGLVRLGLDTSSFWLRPREGALVPFLAALKAQPQAPLREAFRPQAPSHERPRSRVEVAFLPPEALLGEETDARSDLYAVGAVLYEMLTGLPPLSADDAWTALQTRAMRSPAPLSDVRPDVPEELSAVVMRLLSFAPSERYPSAWAALQALPGAAPPDGISPRVAEPAPPASLLVPDFVGRAPAMARLEAAFEAAAGSQSQVVVVAGDEGLGKTRLVDEFLARLRLRGVATFRGRFHPDERALYYRPFGELYKALFPVGRRVPDEVEHVVSHVFPELQTGNRQRPRGTPGRRPPAGPPRREEILEILARLVLSLQPAGGPICLVLEQLAGDDPDHTSLLQALGTHFQGKPVLVVATLRPGSEPLARANGSTEVAGVRVDRLDLEPLPARDIALVAASALGNREVPEGRAGALAEECHGSPLVCLELLKQGPRAAADDEAPIIMGPEDVVVTRLAALPDEARLCLEAGAVLGQSFERQSLVRVAELSEEDVWAQLPRLVAQDFLRVAIVSGRLELSFPHPVYRRSVLKSATPARRSLLHLRTGHYIESKFKRGATETLWDLAYQFSRGSEDAKKARYGALAADRAADLFAVDAALRFFKTALQAGVPDDKLGRVRLKLEGLLALAGRESEVRSLPDAAPTAGAIAQDAATLLAEGKQAMGATEYRKAAKLLHLAIERGGRDPEAAEAACSLGALQRRLGAYARAADVLSRAIALAGTEGRSAAIARIDLGRVQHLQGNLDAARKSYAEALELTSRLGQPDVDGYVRAFSGRLLVSEGRMDEALKELLQAQQVVAKGGDQSGAAWVALALGAYFEEVRNDTEALAHYELAQRGAGDARTRVRGMVGAARSLTRLDRVPDAEAKVHGALEACQAPGAYDLAWQAHNEAGRAFRITGRLEEALHAYARAATAIEVLMDQSPLGRGERAGFLKHDGRLKAFRGLLAVRLLIDKHPSLIEFAADDYLIALIDRFYDDRYRQRKKLSERLERMVEWLLRNREQIRIRKAPAPVAVVAPGVAEAAPPAERVLPPRVPKVDRLEGKNLLRMAAVLGSLGDTDALKAHLLDMALDVVDAEAGVLGLMEGDRMKSEVARELKGREAEIGLERLAALKDHRDLEDLGPVVTPASREPGAPSVLLLPLVKGDTLKGGIYVEGATVARLSEQEKKYLKGLASIAIMALDVSREHVRALSESSRLGKENRRLQQEQSRGRRGEGEGEEAVEDRDRRGRDRDRGRGRDRGRPDRERERERERENVVEAAGVPEEPKELDAMPEGAAPGAEGEIALPLDRPQAEELVAGEAAEGDDAEARISRRARRAQEKQEIVDALRAAAWNRKDAALKLGISRSTLNAKMRRYNIRIKRLRGQAEAAPGGAVASGAVAAGAEVLPRLDLEGAMPPEPGEAEGVPVAAGEVEAPEGPEDESRGPFGSEEESAADEEREDAGPRDEEE